LKGLPIPHMNNKQLSYYCNGYVSWIVTLVTVYLLYVTNIFKISELVDHLGSLMTVAILWGDFFSVLIYVLAFQSKNEHRVHGNFFYDFFMGVYLNPRYLGIDWKLFVETRVWVNLFLLTLAAAVRQYELTGEVSFSMGFMLLAHGFIYANSVMKGEECIPTTWDIFYENFGWMLIYWNCAGVPYVYCFSSMYILRNPPIELPLSLRVAIVVAILLAFWVWESSQAQKNRFRMELRGTYVPRHTFPQLPWNGPLVKPKVYRTANGGVLLVDGWWQYARKPHYTADIVMALCWGLCCGFNHFLPYLYFFFFTTMILHRNSRDIARCQAKYGADWDRYCNIVKYAFIPGIY